MKISSSLTASTAPQPEPRLAPYAWFTIGQAFTTTAVVFGVWFSFAVFFVAMVEEFNWSRGGAAMAFSIGNIAQAAISPLAGMLTDRWGPRGVIASGLLLGALGLIACSQVQTLWHLIALFGGVVGLGVGLSGQVTHAALLARWFVQRRGTIIGVAFAGMGLGIQVVGPLAQWLILSLGWRHTFVILGLGTAVYALFVALTLRNTPQEVGLQPYGSTRQPPLGETSAAMAKPPVASWTIGQALRTREFWILAVAQILVPVGVFPISVHQVAYLADIGFSKILAAAILGHMGLMSSCGRVIFGALSDRLGRFGGVTLSVLFSQLGIVVLLLITSTAATWPLYVYALFFGLGYGARGPIISAIAADLFPGRYFATIFLRAHQYWSWDRGRSRAVVRRRGLRCGGVVYPGVSGRTGGTWRRDYLLLVRYAAAYSAI